MPLRERRKVTGVEKIGPYTLVRIDQGNLDPGIPGQFFMVEAPGRVLPRPFSLCLAEAGELAFLIDAIGPGTLAIAEVSVGDQLHVFGPIGNGYRLDVERPVLVGGGIGVAPFPFTRSVLGAGTPVVLGFRNAHFAEAAALLPGAEVVIDPVLVTEAIPDDHDILACGPEPMLHAILRDHPTAQLAWEAPMACGYGACFGCVVEIDGTLKRLCLEGPVIGGAPPVFPAVPA